MKKVWLLALLAVVGMSAPGCSRPWFSRGASCNTCPTGVPDCHGAASPGMGAPGMQGIPDGGGYLPAPISS